MIQKKKDLHAIPDEMQAVVDWSKERESQSKRELLDKALEIAREKMGDEFVNEVPDNELVEIRPSENDGIFDPREKSDDGDIMNPDINS